MKDIVMRRWANMIEAKQGAGTVVVLYNPNKNHN